MTEETDGWTKEDWALYRKLVRDGQDGRTVLSQEAIREVNRRRRAQR
jgi:hypothetical protein